MSEMNQLPRRGEVPMQAQWDLTTLFATDADWERGCEAVLAALPPLAAFQGKLGQSGELLAEFLTLRDENGRLAKQLELYADLKTAVDANDQTANAQTARARALLAQFQASVAFAEPELMALGQEKLARLQAESPRLRTYARYFEWLEARRPHTRSAEIEQLLAQLGDPFNTPRTIYGQLADADLTFAPAVDSQGKPHPVAQSTFLNQIVHPDRELRRTAFESFSDAHLAVRNSLAQILTGSVKQDDFRAKARGYASTLAASLDPKQIPHAVFHNLLHVFQQKLPVWHRYWRLRRKILGVETLYEYDVKAPLTRQSVPVSYGQAVAWISASMEPLGRDYVETLRHGATNGRWVDIYPNQGKLSTAFSAGIQGANPFVLVNYSDDVFGMSILAHELGHAMHSWYANQAQPYVYTAYTDFAAEVAANFNQAMLRRYLFATQTETQVQIVLLEEMMSNYHRYFFLMPTLARFELALHEHVGRGAPLTTQGMIELLADLFGEAYGGEVALDRERQGIIWSQFIHLYNNYYIFQYMTGIAGAAFLSEQVAAGHPRAAERYLTFLKSGGYDYPIAALQKAGVDLASPEPIEAAFGLMEQAIDRLEMLILGTGAAALP